MFIMLLIFSLVSSESVFYFGGQAFENIIIRGGVVARMFLLIAQCNIYKHHYSYLMVAFVTLILRRVYVVAVGYHLSCGAVYLLVGAVDGYLQILVINVQSYM